MVTVMRFEKYDIVSDEVRRSRRLATPAAIAQHGLIPVAGTEVDVDPTHLNGDGMTAIGFEPSPRVEAAVNPEPR